MAGMSVIEFLDEEDIFKRNLMMMIARRFLEIQERMDHNRAVMIANAVGKMLGGH